MVSSLFYIFEQEILIYDVELCMNVSNTLKSDEQSCLIKKTTTPTKLSISNTTYDGSVDATASTGVGYVTTTTSAGTTTTTVSSVSSTPSSSAY